MSIDIYSTGKQEPLTEEMMRKAISLMYEMRPCSQRARYISMTMYKEYQDIGPIAFFKKYPWMI